MRINSSHWLVNRPIAHRGLWTEEIPENSLWAYRNAIEHGYPIEIDVQRSRDGVLFVFHDDNLKRMTEKDALLHEVSSEEIKALTLNGTEQKIPTLQEVLECVKGKVPLLIEIKNQPNNKIVDDTINLLREYKGDFAIQSFNPSYIIKTKKLAPEIIRGVLGGERVKGSKIKTFVINKMPLNILAKPDFISYNLKMLPIKNKKKLPLLCWTVRNNEQQARAEEVANNIIFEKFIPKK